MLCLVHCLVYKLYFEKNLDIQTNCKNGTKSSMCHPAFPGNNILHNCYTVTKSNKLTLVNWRLIRELISVSWRFCSDVTSFLTNVYLLFEVPPRIIPGAVSVFPGLSWPWCFCREVGSFFVSLSLILGLFTVSLTLGLFMFRLKLSIFGKNPTGVTLPPDCNVAGACDINIIYCWWY